MKVPLTFIPSELTVDVKENLSIQIKDLTEKFIIGRALRRKMKPERKEMIQ